MKNKVLILMSTYNGAERIVRQVESILNQIGVDVYINIRDDGSSENTLKILKSLEKKYYDKVKIQYCKNVGWKESFLDLLFKAPLNYDYYGFSDQDDIWKQDKIIRSIQEMEMDNLYDGAKLVRCRSVSTDIYLRERNEQEKYYNLPNSYKKVIATEYFQGCSMLWNYSAMNILQCHKVHNHSLAHDYWVGVVCYLCGKVYFCDERLFYHIRYEVNSSQDGQVWLGRFQRIRSFFSNSSIYMNPSEDLLEGFSIFLSSSQNEFLLNLYNYKKNIKSKILLLFDYEFRRPTFWSTMVLKISILFNRI